MKAAACLAGTGMVFGVGWIVNGSAHAVWDKWSPQWSLVQKATAALASHPTAAGLAAVAVYASGTCMFAATYYHTFLRPGARAELPSTLCKYAWDQGYRVGFAVAIVSGAVCTLERAYRVYRPRTSVAAQPRIKDVDATGSESSRSSDKF